MFRTALARAAMTACASLGLALGAGAPTHAHDAAMPGMAPAGASPALGAAAVFPVHGTLESAAGGRAVVALDAVTGMLPAGRRTVAFAPPRGLAPGGAFDALASGPAAALRLSDGIAAERFEPGLPHPLIAHVVAEGDRLPDATLLDQRGVPFRLADARGRTTLLSFIFTRCPDRTQCPEISAKFSYMQRHLDPAHFRLVEITLDPTYDSPATLAAYGAAHGADPRLWTLATGRATDVGSVAASFGIAEVENGPANIVHDDRLAIVAPDGTIRSLLETAGWNPDDAIAVARNAGGFASSPLRRFELATLAGVIALCGGSTSTAIVALDSVVFVVGVAILGGILAWWGRQIFAKN